MEIESGRKKGSARPALNFVDLLFAVVDATFSL
jgi:hypothetical protein